MTIEVLTERLDALQRVRSPRAERAALLGSSAPERLFDRPATRSPVSVEACAVHYKRFYDEDGALVPFWRWSYFPPSELACSRTGLVYANETVLDMLQEARRRFGHPLPLTSFYRTRAHNSTLPGAGSNSFHLYGEAADIQVSSCRSLEDIIRLRGILRAVGFSAVVDYPRNGFIHVDIRKSGSVSWKGYDVGGDPGFAGEAWSPRFVDRDGRIEEKARSVEERVKDTVVGGGAMSGTAALISIDPSIMQLLKFGLPTAGAVLFAYVVLTYRRPLWEWFSRRWRG